MNVSLPEEEYKDFSRRIWEISNARTVPTRVQFEITYRCNIHCVHCYTDPFNKSFHLRKELGLEELLRIFDDLKEAGVLWMLLTGGEAMVHPQFRRIYKEAKRRGFIVSLFSNGTVITDDLADFLAEDPPFKLELSCHGATDETFDKITQVPNSFQRFKEGVRRLRERNLPLKIKTKAMTMNRHELQDIKTFVESLGLDFDLYTKIYPRLDGDLSSTVYRLEPHEILELEMANNLDPEEEGESCLGESEEPLPLLTPPQNNRLFRCGCGTTTAMINPYGFIRACTFTTWPTYDLKEMSFKEAFQKLARTIQEACYTGSSPCRVCPVYRFCEKNPAMAAHESGSREAPVEHFCELAYGKAERLTGQTLR